MHVRLISTLALVVVACGGTGDSAGPAAGSAPETVTTRADVPSDRSPATSEPATPSVASAPDEPAGERETGVQPCADVIDGSIVALGDGTFRVAATVRSGDTGWDKYADAWEVRTLDGTVLEVRVLAHPHETEQPFTRTLSPVVIPADVERVVLVAHDLLNGFCGATFSLDVPHERLSG